MPCTVNVSKYNPDINFKRYKPPFVHSDVCGHISREWMGEGVFIHQDLKKQNPALSVTKSLGKET